MPRNVTIGFYGPLSLREGTDPAWIEAAAQAYRSDEAATRALLSGAHSLRRLLYLALPLQLSTALLVLAGPMPP